MFIDKEQRAKISEHVKASGATGFFAQHKGLKITIISVSALLLLTIIIFYIVLSNRQIIQEAETEQIEQTGDIVGLPEANKTDINYLLGDDEINDLKSEQVVFGTFYRQPTAEAKINNPGILLPTNVKTEADNYYSLTRYIDLDQVIEELNSNGLAVIDNPFSKEANDFYSIYELFKEKNIPFLLTNDFLIYYYQNSLKHIFKQIEAEVFYREFWDINKELFDIADKRYRERSARQGVLNDPIMEAERLETAYFATALEILKPKDGQILDETEKDYVDQTKFSAVDVKYYNFELPEYLRVDVEKELALINKGKKNGDQPIKSPALLYWRDYSKFEIPDEYVDNSKLYNFYLANKWANTLFPLYYQSDECPNCLLDKDDWQVNFIAAHLIADDFDERQDLKNRWAKIYKVISYFSGLRNELTYLHYSDALLKSYGPDADLTKILAANNPERENNLDKLQNWINSYVFDTAQGGYDLQNQAELEQRGMRLLQENYWPDDYIYKQLTFDQTGDYNLYNFKARDNDLTTTCVLDSRQTTRCRAILFDIVNIIFEEDTASHVYFDKNINYEYYPERINQIRLHYGKFDDVDWHNSSYWSMLDIDNIMLESRKIDHLPYTQTDAWTNINLNTAVGAMFNQAMPIDEWTNSFRKEAFGLQETENIVKYNYIEPNLKLVNELLANARMLFKTLYSLDLIQINDDQFTILLNDLITSRELILKELADQEFNFDDWKFLNDFVGQYYISKLSEKNIKTVFVSPDSQKEYKMQQSLDDLKLLINIQFYQNRQILVVGPIFNYQEVNK